MSVKQIKQNLPWILQFAGLLVIILNLWLASKLSPLAEDINKAEFRISALEIKSDTHDISCGKVGILEDRLIRIQSDIQEIKQDIKKK